MNNIRIISVILFVIMLLMSTITNVNAGLKKPTFDINEKDIDDTDVPIQCNLTSNKFAVIIVGGYGTFNDSKRTQYYRWYLNAAQGIHNMLTDKYGYDDENIYTLITKIKDYEFPEGFDESIIDLPSNRDNIRNILNSFKTGGKNELDEDDLLFVTFINHGGDGRYFLNKVLGLPNGDGVNAHNTFFLLEPRFNFIYRYLIKYNFVLQRIFFPNTIMFDYQFAGYFKGIKARTILALQPCSSGGYINDLSGENRIICTASRENQTAFASWIEPFTKALAGIIEADYNLDGNVSIFEAFRCATEEVKEEINEYPDLPPQHPLIDDNSDKIGHQLIETGYDPTYGEDGYLAVHTFL